ncbi:hypothetical protein N7495_007912 [Penicillium taxi]|uniref:uncharacterized protein n=1 Tax=Penicillium taxi TaxID=168475 RepID=UPI0025452D43|nr:uncharacterized protein N7495_007912 [Penicillium taxi]KAJ5887871.1 hypothetical protein N7495_007912 [Penicillium taxi]
MAIYKEGDRVSYKPVGGPNSNTSASTGIIRGVTTTLTTLSGRSMTAMEQEPRYQIENDNTSKNSVVKECNILGPAD